MNDVFISDADKICQEIKYEAVIPSTNGITNGDDTGEHNGTGLARHTQCGGLLVRL